MKVRTKKKAFTIVELVVVIAVIAVLAAVLIPTFSNVIKKAQKSSDTQLVRNLNTALTVDGEEHDTMYDALDAAAKAGYIVDKINANQTGNEILWDSKNDVFCYLDEGAIKYIPETTLTTPQENLKPVDYWRITKEDKYLKAEAKYSVYYMGDLTEIETTVGFDAGEKTNITEVKYVRPAGAASQSTMIRTNGNTKVDVQAENDNVTVYGQGTEANGEAVSNNSLHIRGEFPTVYIKTGRVVFEQDATTNVVVVTGTDAIIGYSEALPVEKYPETQRLAGVNSYKVQETSSEDSAAKREGTVTFADNEATVPTVSGEVSDAVKDNQGTAEKPAVTVSEDAISNSSNFAGGLGTEKSPYLIATNEQFANIQKLSDENYYIKGCFKLINDVFYDGDTMDYLINSTFDGNGHKLTFKGSTGGWPSLFAATGGVCEIKNLNYECDGLVKELVAYTNYFTNSTTTYNNITVTSTSEDIIPTWGYGCSAFTHLVWGTAYFKDCVVDMNYTIQDDTAYAGIFVGNYPQHGSYVSFENCVNKGIVNGGYVGFFTGNTCSSIIVTDSATPVVTESAATVYINNCANEGTMIGAQEISAFACNNSAYKSSHTQANAALTSSQFVSGAMTVGGIELELTFDGNEFTIVGSNDERINYYEVGYYASIGYTNGSGRFSYSVRVSKEDVASGRVFPKATIVSIVEFENNGGDYAALGEELQASQYGYKVQNNADGTITIVVNITGDTFTGFGNTEYSVSAYTAEGMKLGYKENKGLD